VTSELDRQIFAIHRPSPELMKYYVFSSLLFGPFFFVPLTYLYFRYYTMRYEFDEEGISMRWGILFRREITLTYARIQIQTASASAAAEMTVEGLHEFERVRDFLYSKMRGVRGTAPTAATPATAAPSSGSDLAAALREVAAELRAVREALERRQP
jgi:uncharacterized protein